MGKEHVKDVLEKVLGDNFKRMFYEWGKTVEAKSGWVSFEDLSAIEEFSRLVKDEEEFLSGALCCDTIEVDSEKKVVRLKTAAAGNLMYVEVTGVPKEATAEELKKFFSPHGVVSHVTTSPVVSRRNKAILSIDTNGGKSLLSNPCSYGETDCPLTNRFIPKIYAKQVQSPEFDSSVDTYKKPEKYLKSGHTLKVTGDGLQSNVPIATLAFMFGEKYSSFGKGVRFSTYLDAQTALILFRTKDLAEHSMYAFVSNPTPARGVQLSVSIASDREQEFIRDKAFEHEQTKMSSKKSAKDKQSSVKRAKMEGNLMERVDAGDFEFA